MCPVQPLNVAALTFIYSFTVCCCRTKMLLTAKQFTVAFVYVQRIVCYFLHFFKGREIQIGIHMIMINALNTTILYSLPIFRCCFIAKAGNPKT